MVIVIRVLSVEHYGVYVFLIYLHIYFHTLLCACVFWEWETILSCYDIMPALLSDHAQRLDQNGVDVYLYKSLINEQIKWLSKGAFQELVITAWRKGSCGNKGFIFRCQLGLNDHSFWSIA